MALQTGRARRTAALLSLPAGAAALSVRGLARRVAGDDPELVRRELRARNAARTREVLGGLKGGAQKAGQLLSTVEALFPADPEDSWRRALTGLQESGEPLPFAEVEPVLRAELGPGWRSDLPQLDENAAAAASLGQVHRGRWWDGREVAVKVQYPGVREALRSDLRTLSAVTRTVGVLARGLALPPLVAEVRDRLLEELDYEREARVQTAVRDGFAEDPSMVVPTVVAATPRVLVSTWLDGVPLAQVALHGDQAERDRVGAAYQSFLVSGPARSGWLHTDPHPGNFRVTEEGRFGVLDFGSALALPEGMPPTFGRLLRVLLAGGDAQVLAGLHAEGMLRPGARLGLAEVGELREVMAPFVEPARHASFRFSRAWLASQFPGGESAQAGDARAPSFTLAMQLTLPAEHLFTHRVWLGLVGVLCQLEAEVPLAPVLRRWLPGFT